MWLDLGKPSMYAQKLKFYNSHTQALSRHNDKIAIDKQVCFYRQLFADHVKLWKTKTKPVGQLRGINRVACDPKLFHWMPAWLMVWSGTQGLLWPSVWPTRHTTWLAVPTGSTNPPTPSTLPTYSLIHSTRDIAGCVQNVSQNQPVQPVAIYYNDSYCPILFLVQSYMATIKHKEST